jgi:hypothetical protein
MDETNTQQRRVIKSFDVDIDFADRDQALTYFTHIPASMYRDDTLVKHNTGIYFTRIPLDPVLGAAAIDYKTAESRGYFKVDCLNVSVYRLIRDQEHYDWLLAQEPAWARLWQDPVWAAGLVHVGNYTKLLEQMRPDSVLRMAAFMSIIRPGKAHLRGLPWDQVLASVWDGDSSRGYVFKKAHAVSYSMLVCLHMNILNQPPQSVT